MFSLNNRGGFLGKKSKDGSVYRIYVNHPYPPSQTFDSDYNNISPFLAETEELALMFNSKS